MTPIPTRPNEYRCPACNRRLIVGSFTGWIEPFCERCKKPRRFDEPSLVKEERPPKAA